MNKLESRNFYFLLEKLVRAYPNMVDEVCVIKALHNLFSMQQA